MLGAYSHKFLLAMRPFRAAATAAVLLILAACGSEPTKAQTGTLVFHADASCPSCTVELTVDDVVKGAYALHPGSTVQSFTVSAGNHTAEAQMTDGSGFWPEVHFIVDADQTYTLSMQC